MIFSPCIIFTASLPTGLVVNIQYLMMAKEKRVVNV
jgi:hypothetical protein